MITAEYNVYGYEIYHNGDLIYSAGNSSADSQIWLEPFSKGALPPGAIRAYAVQTAKDLADELGDEFGGIEKRESE